LHSSRFSSATLRRLKVLLRYWQRYDPTPGPVESSFGFHVVRVNDAVPTSVPALDDVRDEVLLDWKAEKASLLREQVYAQFRERYEIVFPGTAAASDQ